MGVAPRVAKVVILIICCQTVGALTGVQWSASADFRAPPPLPPPFNAKLQAYLPAATGDVTGDGAPDLVLASGAGVTVVAGIGLPQPTNISLPALLTAHQTVLDIALANITQSPALDIVVAVCDTPVVQTKENSAAIFVFSTISNAWMEIGNCTVFSSLATYSLFYMKLVVGNFDSDPRTDIVVACNEVKAFFNIDPLLLTPDHVAVVDDGSLLAGAQTFISLAAGDLDGDGDVDLTSVSGVEPGGGVYVYENLGGGSFASALPLPNATRPTNTFGYVSVLVVTAPGNTTPSAIVAGLFNGGLLLAPILPDRFGFGNATLVPGTSAFLDIAALQAVTSPTVTTPTGGVTNDFVFGFSTNLKKSTALVVLRTASNGTLFSLNAGASIAGAITGYALLSAPTFSALTFQQTANGTVLGLVVLSVCPVNSFQNGSTAVVCTPCGANTVSNTPGATTAAVCTSCPAGFVRPINASSCSPCPNNTFVSMTQLGSCGPCAANTWSGGAGLNCSFCPPGSQRPVSSPTCTACGLGTYSPGQAESCAACTNNTIAPSTGAAQCTPCTGNSVASSDLTACVSCPGGQFFNATALACDDCPSYYQVSLPYSSSCEYCMNVSAPNDDRSGCDPCNASSILQEYECVLCAGNSLPNEAQTACVPGPVTHPPPPPPPSLLGGFPLPNLPSTPALIGITFGVLFVCALCIGCLVCRCRRGGASAPSTELRNPTEHDPLLADATRASDPDSTRTSDRSVSSERNKSQGATRASDTPQGTNTFSVLAVDTSKLRIVQLAELDVVRKLGEGGFGAVYHVREKATLTDFALKTLTSEVGRAQVKTFMEEVQVLSNLRHPNCLSCLGIMLTDQEVGVLTELKSGGDLAGASSFPLAKKLAALCGAAKGLAYLHGRGMVHADVKDTNILLDEYGNAALADFGLSAFQKGQRGMSPRWSSYSVFSGAAATTADDIFSFGLVIIACLSGRRPFDHLGRTARGARDLPYPDLPAFTPVDVRALAERCLAREGSDRPGAGEVVTELAKHVQRSDG